MTSPAVWPIRTVTERLVGNTIFCSSHLYIQNNYCIFSGDGYEGKCYDKVFNEFELAQVGELEIIQQRPHVFCSQVPDGDWFNYNQYTSEADDIGKCANLCYGLGDDYNSFSYDNQTSLCR